MKKINLRGLTKALSTKELKNVLGGSYGWDGCGCSGSYCERSTGQTVICCEQNMEFCYKLAKSLWNNTESHSCGNCAG